MKTYPSLTIANFFNYTYNPFNKIDLRCKWLREYIITSEGITPCESWVQHLKIDNHLKRLIIFSILRKTLSIMTSEILILNKEAVALAADSAATLSSEKIFITNKIFMLSKYHPVGIMIYGNSQYMDIPWELIIKEYRKNDLKNKRFDTLKGYVDNFIDYIRNNETIFLKEDLDKRLTFQLVGSMNNLFSLIREKIVADIGDVISFNSSITYEEIKEISCKNIVRYERELSNIDMAPTISEEDVKQLTIKNRGAIEELIKDVFENLPIDEKKEDLIKFAIGAYLKVTLRDQISGVVVVGFGEKDIFPSFSEFKTIGLINGTFRVQEPDAGEIRFDQGSGIIPFAQEDMVARFMKGIDPNLQEFYSNTCSKIFQKYREKIVDKLVVDINQKKRINEELSKVDSELVEEFDGIVDAFIQENYCDPITDIVAHLPKNDLADMAESLVNLTSFKRHVSTDVESVGGPIDVALISKGDGFIWVKRKRYFDPESNPQFFANYYRDNKDDGVCL